MTAGTNEQGFIAGGATGALSGAAIGATLGGPVGAGIGAGVGFLVGGTIGYMQADAQRMAAKEAQKAQERARRRAVMREMGAAEQADLLAFSGANNAPDRGSQSSQAPGVINAPNAPGTIASNVYSSGTF
jgi:uncharacterized protein YcfJ